LLIAMKATIDQYISFLLYSNECVVLPGFGAFLTRYYPAEINHATQMMRPPSKRVSFNKRINENDGLLAKTISKEENISYQQALESIDISVRSWKRMLADGNKVKLEGIGRLYLNDHGNLQFSPAIDINYDINSFGLGIFRSEATNRDIAIKKTITTAISSHKKEKAKNSKGKKINIKPMRWAAVLIPIAVIGISGTLYLGGDFPEVKNFSGWGPSYSKSAPADESLKEDVPSEQTTPESLSEKDGLTEISENPIEEPDVPEEIVPLEETGSSPSADPVKPTTVITSKPFHIIVGSFKEQHNAENYVSLLQSKGYDAYIAKDGSGFHRVSVGNFADRSEADQQLLSIKNTLNSGSWVYRN